MRDSRSWVMTTDRELRPAPLTLPRRTYFIIRSICLTFGDVKEKNVAINACSGKNSYFHQASDLIFAGDCFTLTRVNYVLDLSH